MTKQKCIVRKGKKKSKKTKGRNKKEKGNFRGGKDSEEMKWR